MVFNETYITNSQVADYNDTGLVFNSNDVKFYDGQGEETDKPESTCFQCDCIYRFPDDPFIQVRKNMTIEGEFYIAAFLPFHSSASSHSLTHTHADPESVILSEGIRMTLKRINADLFGRNLLGVTIHDTFSDKHVSSLQTTLVMKAGRYLRQKNYDINENEFVGVFTYGTGIDSKVRYFCRLVKFTCGIKFQVVQF